MGFISNGSHCLVYGECGVGIRLSLIGPPPGELLAELEGVGPGLELILGPGPILFRLTDAVGALPRWPASAARGDRRIPGRVHFRHGQGPEVVRSDRLSASVDPADQGLPTPTPDHKILWSGLPGKVASGLYFHQVIEKEGVAVRRMVYILVIIGSPGGKPPEGQSHNDRPRLISGPMLIRMVASEFGKASMIFWSTRQIGVNSGFAPKRA